MKIVINRCYGGFSLSPRAVQRLAELEGKPCYFFISEIDKPYRPIDLPDQKESFPMWVAFTVPNPNEILRRSKDWHEMSDKEKIAWNNLYFSIDLDNRPDGRTDSLLIQAIEELGTEVASGALAELEIVEIPDGVDWQIEGYDGMEWVAEKHRTWR